MKFLEEKNDYDHVEEVELSRNEIER